MIDPSTEARHESRPGRSEVPVVVAELVTDVDALVVAEVVTELVMVDDAVVVAVVNSQFRNVPATYSSYKAFNTATSSVSHRTFSVPNGS